MAHKGPAKQHAHSTFMCAQLNQRPVLWVQLGLPLTPDPDPPGKYKQIQMFLLSLLDPF